MSANTIIQKLDELLKDDRLDTRGGLYFLGELVKDAFTYIEEERAKNKIDDDTLKSFSFRVGNVEKTLNSFLEKREDEQKKAEDERTWYRHTVVGALILLIIGQLAQWFLK